jgi:NAD kinase
MGDRVGVRAGAGSDEVGLRVMRGENKLGGLFTPKLGLLVSNTPQAEEAAAEVRSRHDFVEIAEADAVVALGGDGFMLAVLHRVLHSRNPNPSAL